MGKTTEAGQASSCLGLGLLRGGRKRRLSLTDPELLSGVRTVETVAQPC